MILAVDVGNTNIVIGLLDTDRRESVYSWRLSSNRERTADEWRALLDPLLGRLIETVPVDGAIIASVVPAITTPIQTLCREWVSCEPLLVSSSLDLGFELGMDRPGDVGADRIANAAAALALIPGASLIIDLGTATKIEAIDQSRVFRGGVIAPGIGMSRDALASRAARLFAVELSEPARAIGRNTIEAVQNGLVRGHARMIEGLVSDIWRELDDQTPLLLTGGLAPLIAPLLRFETRLEPDLTLIGLGQLFLRNSGH